MTLSIDTTAHEELTNEPPSDYGVDVAGDRARAIAAIHAYANWLAAHPDVRLPSHVVGHAHIHSTTRSEQSRLDELADFQSAHGGERLTASTTHYVRLKLTDTAALVIDHDLMTTIPDRPL